MELNSFRGSFEHVVKKRKLSSAKCHEVVDSIGNELEQALSKVQQSNQDPTLPVDHKSFLSDLKSKLNGFSPEKELETSQKELNINLNKYHKLLEKALYPDISKGYARYRKIDFDVQTTNQIVTDHFISQGLFDIGDCLVKEAGMPEVNVVRAQLFEMYQIVEALRAKNLQPALDWVSANHEKLRENGSSLKLKLHQLQFVELLNQGSQIDAVIYARENLSPLASSHMVEIQKIMLCILWTGRLEKCPYSQLVGPTNWEKLADELSRQFCALLGRSCRAPLAVAVGAGSETLPTLLKLINRTSVKRQDWQAMEELPFPLDLGKDFQFHSTFICPVTRDQGTTENPPMLMPCGHVLCRQSILKLSKNGTRLFKCPYCPSNALVAQCRQLYF